MRFEANTEQGFSAMDRVKAYLDAFDHDKPMPAMAYRQELKALNLDYSAESLIRLDNFLTELRVGTRPEFQQYMQRGDLQQMLTFLGMYLGTTIARVTRQSIRWMERQEVNERGTWGQLPDMFTTMISCALADTLLHLPLEVICLILFDPDQAETCVQRLNFYRKNAKPLQPFYRTSLSKVIIAQTEAEKTWAAAMRLGGVLAAYGIYLARAEALAPTTLSGSAFQTFMDTPAEIAIDQIRKNPQKLPFQSLAFDAYINLPEGRQDAVSVVIFCYGEFAVEWKIMLPYRREADGAGLVFSTPLLAFSSRSNVNLPLLSHAFYVGVNSFKTPDNTWNECLRE